MTVTRRDLLGIVATTGIASVVLDGFGAADAQPASAPLPSLIESGGGRLKALIGALARAPRHRDFKEVPMILTSPAQWDHEALALLTHYRGGPKQVWDNTAIDSPWLNLMRNSLNAQIWAFKHPDFLVVSATHGTAHLALYDETLWEKYGLAKLTGGKFARNTLLDVPAAAHGNAADLENPAGVFSPKDNSIPTLQARGVVFLACHNAIFELTSRLHATDRNPDKLSLAKMGAEFTNHLIPGAVLTPGIVGTLPELGAAGFQYAT